MWLHPPSCSTGVLQPVGLGRQLKTRGRHEAPTWTVLPASLFHLMIQLGRSITTMFRTASGRIDGL